MSKTYTQEDMDDMKKELDTNFRLSNIEKTCDDISDAVLKHIAIEKEDSMEIMKAVEQGAIDRRQCEKDIRKTIDENHEVYHSTFVKKGDLKLYASLIILTIGAAASFQAWQTKQHVPSTQLLQSIEKLIKRGK